MSRSTETDDNELDPPPTESETDTTGLSTPRVGRRGYLGLVGASVGTALFGTQPARATETGYGTGEYGLGGYGGTEDESTADPPEDSDDADDSEDELPNVLTVSAEPEASTATLWGLVWSLGESESATVFFEYRTSDAEEWSETDSTTRSSWGAFERSVTDLEPSTDYEYRAVVTIDDESAVGETETFRTPAADESSSLGHLTAEQAAIDFEHH